MSAAPIVQYADLNNKIVFSVPGTIAKVSITLDQAQVNNLTTDPILLIPSPGPGKVIVPLWLTEMYNFGTLQFTVAGASMTINTENGINSWLVVPTGGCIDQTASQFAFVAPTTQGPNLLTDYENQGISIQNPGVNFLGGIGCTIELELAYYVAGLPQTL